MKKEQFFVKNFELHTFFFKFFYSIFQDLLVQIEGITIL